MKTILLLLGMAWAVHSSAADSGATSNRSRVAPAPLYRDPVHDGAADATLIWNRAEKCWWMLYTIRRADADEEKSVKWVHGTDIGIASTPDGGLTWTYRGVARGLEFETNGMRNTFWAPEVVDFGSRYHAFISYVRGVPETWKGTRDILHYTSTNLLDWKFESVVVPGSIDACVHRLPDGRWRMWFKNEQRKIRGTVLDSDDLFTWKPTASEMPDPDPGKGEGPEVFRWKGWFWMVKDLWRGLGVYRSADLDHWKFMGVILDKPGKRPGDQRIGQHPGALVQDSDRAYLIYFVHQAEKEPAYRHTWLQIAQLGFDGTTLTCERNAEVEIDLKEPASEFTAEHIPSIRTAPDGMPAVRKSIRNFTVWKDTDGRPISCHVGQRNSAEEHGWGQDLGLFQDTDGKGYIVYDDGHRNMRVDLLADDYLSSSGRTTIALQSDRAAGKVYEGAAMIRYRGKYIVAGSGVKGWNPTDTTYAVANAPLGPYREMGLDLLDRGLLADNAVTLSDELVAAFKRYFEIVRWHNDQPTIQNPFYFLSGDGFCSLVPAAGQCPLYELYGIYWATARKKRWRSPAGAK